MVYRSTPSSRFLCALGRGGIVSRFGFMSDLDFELGSRHKREMIGYDTISVSNVPTP